MKRAAPFFTVILGMVLSCIGQTAPDADVSRRSVRLMLPGASCPEIFSGLAMMNKLPTGFQQRAGAAGAESEGKHDVLFQNGIHLGMLMTGLMQDCPGYSWSGGNVLSISPSPREGSVLDVVIPQLNAEQVSAQDLLDRLFETPEVKRYLKDQKISRRTADQPLSSNYPDPKKYSFSFSNRSVRDILNHIVTTTRYKIGIHQGPEGAGREVNVRIF